MTYVDWPSIRHLYDQVEPGTGQYLTEPELERLENDIALYGEPWWDEELWEGILKKVRGRKARAFWKRVRGVVRVGFRAVAPSVARGVLGMLRK